MLRTVAATGEKAVPYSAYIRCARDCSNATAATGGSSQRERCARDYTTLESRVPDVDPLRVGYMTLGSYFR